MTEIAPYTVRLRSELNAIQAEMVTLLQASRLEATDVAPNPMLQINAAYQGRSVRRSTRLSWRNLTPEQEAVQAATVRRFEEWHQSFNILFRNVGETQRREIQLLVLGVLTWIRFRYYGSLPSSVSEAVQSFNQAVQVLLDLLATLIEADPPTCIIVPDTNVLIDYQDLPAYAKSVPQLNCNIIIPITVLRELEDLKQKRRSDKPLSAKISAVLRKLDDLESLGDVLVGVKMTDQVTVRMTAIEPRFEDLPSWLDKNDWDDRVIAAALDLQQANATLSVIILSNDRPMRLKAKLAMLPCLRMTGSP